MPRLSSGKNIFNQDIVLPLATEVIDLTNDEGDSAENPVDLTDDDMQEAIEQHERAAFLRALDQIDSIMSYEYGFL